MSPSPIPLAPGSPRGSRPATEARARRVRAGSPSPIPLAPGSPRGSRPATEARARRVRAGCPRPPSLSLRGLRGARAPLRKPEPEGFGPGVPVPHPSRSGVSAGLAPRYGSPSQKGSSRVSPSPIPLAPGSPRGSRPATEARARRVRAGCPRPPSLSLRGLRGANPPLRGLRGARAPLRKPERRCIPAEPPGFAWLIVALRSQYTRAPA